MAASQAGIGYGTFLAVETSLGSGVWTDIAEVSSVTAPNAAADQVERTHMQSPNRTKEFAQGLIDPGDAAFKLNHIPGDSVDNFIVAWKAAGDVRGVRITYPNAHTQTFPAFVKGYAPDAFNPSGLLSATLTLKVAGAVVEA